MKKFNSFEDDDPFNVEGYRVQNRLHPPSYARKSSSLQRSCGPRSPFSQSALRKQQLRSRNLYNFAPLHGNNVPAQSYKLDQINFGEAQLPHYVVPVLYIPQRILTNEELYASEIDAQDPVSNKVYQVPPSVPQQLPRFRCQERPTSSLQHVSPSYKRLRAQNQLTDSETDIYDELMAKMYCMEQSEEELPVEKGFRNDDNTPANDCQRQGSQCYVCDNIYPNVIYTREEEKLEDLNPHHGLCSENSSTYLTSDYTKARAPTRRKASSFTKDYVTRNLTDSQPCSPSISAYTVHPMNRNDYDLHKFGKDQRFAHSKIPLKSRGSSCSRKTRRESAANLAKQGQAFNTNLILEQLLKSESKCTQTTEATVDMSTATHTGDHNVCKKSYENMQEAEKGPARKQIKSKSVKCNDADVTVIIDKGSNENIYTLLDSGSQYTNLKEAKFDKSTECLPTVDLLPVESSRLASKSVMRFPKLMTGSCTQSFGRKIV